MPGPQLSERRLFSLHRIFGLDLEEKGIFNITFHSKSLSDPPKYLSRLNLGGVLMEKKQSMWKEKLSRTFLPISSKHRAISREYTLG